MFQKSLQEQLSSPDLMVPDLNKFSVCSNILDCFITPFFKVSCPFLKYVDCGKSTNQSALAELIDFILVFL